MILQKRECIAELSWFGRSQTDEENRVLKSYLLCACDRFRSVDGFGLNPCIFGEKGPDPVGKEGLCFKWFCLGMCFRHVFKL